MPETDTPRKASQPVNHPVSHKVKLDYGELSWLAEQLGVTPGHLSHYFAGRRPSAKLDAAMLERYGVVGAEIEVAHKKDQEEAA